MPAQGAQAVHVRLVDGAPALETYIGGFLEKITPAYATLNGVTVTSALSYGTITPFTTCAAGAASIIARNDQGYAVGPLKTPNLTAGGHYTLIIVGAYPHYSVLAISEPATSGSAQLSLYEASPSTAQASFGSFRASNKSEFKSLGSASYGSEVTVSLGKSVTDFGGYAGPAGAPLGTVTPSQIDSFDSKNALPFNAVARLSLFLFDSTTSSSQRVFGSLDQ